MDPRKQPLAAHSGLHGVPRFLLRGSQGDGEPEAVRLKEAAYCVELDALGVLFGRDDEVRGQGGREETAGWFYTLCEVRRTDVLYRSWS